MARRRQPRRRILLALAIAGLSLAGCVMQPQVQPPAAYEPAPLGPTDADTSDEAPESSWGAAPRGSGPELGDTLLPEAQPIWPDGDLALPSAIGDYRQVGDLAVEREGVTALYTKPDYRMLSATVSRSADGYGARLRPNDGLQHIGSVACGTDVTQPEGDIAWRTCVVVASDGFVSLTAYSTGDVTVAELAQLTEQLYDALAAEASAGS